MPASDEVLHDPWFHADDANPWWLLEWLVPYLPREVIYATEPHRLVMTRNARKKRRERENRRKKWSTPEVLTVSLTPAQGSRICMRCHERFRDCKCFNGARDRFREGAEPDDGDGYCRVTVKARSK